MENKSMRKKIVFVVLCLVAVALIGLSLFQQLLLKKFENNSGAQNNTATQKVESPGIEPQPGPKAVPVNAAPADNISKTNKNDAASLNDQLESAEKELDAANNKLSSKLSGKAELKKKELELQKQYFKDPSIKKIIRASLEDAYGDIFKELNLSPEKLEKFMDLWADQTFEKTQLSPEIQTASTKEQKEDLLRRYKAINDESETKMRELLGNEDYEKFQSYYERGNTRFFVNAYKGTLSASDQLTNEQEKALIEVMFKEERRVYSEIGYDPMKTIEFPSDIKNNSVSGILKNTEKIHQASLENAKGILSTSQLEQLNNYLKNYREMQQMSYKISNQ